MPDVRPDTTPKQSDLLLGDRFLSECVNHSTIRTSAQGSYCIYFTINCHNNYDNHNKNMQNKKHITYNPTYNHFYCKCGT